MSRSVVFVDLFCLESWLKIKQLHKKCPIRMVYYRHATRYLLKISHRFPHIIFKAVSDIDQAAARYQDYSLHEAIQQRTSQCVVDICQHSHVLDRVHTYCQRYHWNDQTLIGHLQDRLFFAIHRFCELEMIIQYLQETQVHVFIRCSPIATLYAQTSPVMKPHYYTTWLGSHRRKKCSDFTAYPDSGYDDDRFCNMLPGIGQWVMMCLMSLCYEIYKKHQQPRQCMVGVELSKPKVRRDEINDVFWVSEGHRDTVGCIEFYNYDSESDRQLADLGVHRYKYRVGLMTWLKIVLVGNRSRRLWQFVTVSLRPALMMWSWNGIIGLARIRWGTKSWIKAQIAVYGIAYHYWKSIYRNMGIKIMVSSRDVDTEKYAKYQALSDLGGISVGMHWSHYPFYVPIINKVCDVLCCWSDHFSASIFNQWPYLKTVSVGYLCDFYFSLKKEKSRQLRMRYEHHYILTYCDNTAYHDLNESITHELALYDLFIELLDAHQHVIIFLKPKRLSYLEEIKKRRPQLEHYIRQKRMIVFSGDPQNPRTKYPPAEVGMASDLVVGLGLNTAALECAFAGTVTFLADFTQFSHHLFPNRDLGHVVFQDHATLKIAIDNRISGKDKRSFAAFKSMYDLLDPFQDGRAYQRMGHVILDLQKGIKEGKSRDIVVKAIQDTYNT